MKIAELSKAELVELLTLLCKYCKGEFRFCHGINDFLWKRLDGQSKQLMAKQDKVDILKDFPKWEALSRKIDNLYTEDSINYNCTLEELKEEEK